MKPWHIYLAIEGTGEFKYEPIEQDAVDVEAENHDKAFEYAVAQFAGNKWHKCKPFTPTDDHKAVAEAQSWGYDEAWFNADGYILFVGCGKPRLTPDPNAYWLTARDKRKITEHTKGGSVLFSHADMDKIVNACCELMQEGGLVSEETVRVVFDINGRSINTVNDILFAVAGERDAMDYYEDELVERGLVKREEEEDDEDEDSDEEVTVTEIG